MYTMDFLSEINNLILSYLILHNVIEAKGHMTKY